MLMLKSYELKKKLSLAVKFIMQVQIKKHVFFYCYNKKRNKVIIKRKVNILKIIYIYKNEWT
jgi:hypothetical protein